MSRSSAFARLARFAVPLALASVWLVAPLRAADPNPVSRSGYTRLRPVIRPQPQWVDAIDQAAKRALDAGVPGLQISVRLGANGFRFNGAWGVANVASGTPTTLDSPFEIGSITKQFTAAEIMRLSERGEVDVQDPVSKWVPELDTHGYHPTLRHLLAHTSGIPNYTDFLEDFTTPMTEAQMIGYIGTLTWNFAPGTSWAYSNSGYYVLGTVIERAGGRSYVDALNDDFFRPLGLIHTSYCGSDPAMPRPIGYFETTPGTIVAAPEPDISLLFSAGGICSTATDLVRWNRALVSGLAVSPASYEAMSTDARLDNGTPINYGYGLFISKYFGRRIIFHGGATFGFLSHLAWYPDYDLTVAVVTNLRPLTTNWSQSVGLSVALTILRDIDAWRASEIASAMRAVRW